MDQIIYHIHDIERVFSQQIIINLVFIKFVRFQLVVFEQYISSNITMPPTNRKKREKRNLFDDDDDDEQPQPPSKDKDYYGAARIQQNTQAYIRETPLKQQDYSNEVSEGRHSKPETKKKLVKAKKKNLFESDDEDSEEKDHNQGQLKEQKIEISDNQQQITENHDEEVHEVGVLMKDSRSPAGQVWVTTSEQSKVEEAGSEKLQSDEDDQKFKRMAQKKTKKQDQEIQEKNAVQILHNISNKKSEMFEFLMMPLKEGFKAQLDFVRVPSGFSQSYRLMMNERALLFSENQRGCIGANYYISLTRQMDKNNESYMGKLRGNSSGSVYNLYDYGNQPNKSLDRSKWRATLGKIEYQTNILGINGPRKLHALVPNITSEQKYDCFKLDDSESLDNYHPPNVIKMRNKQPKWNERLKSYALNFGGRVKLASIKNFIMVDDTIPIDEDANAKNLLVFGKSQENVFSLEVSPPLSIYQAFGIVLSSFDFKFNCE